MATRRQIGALRPGQWVFVSSVPDPTYFYEDDFYEVAEGGPASIKVEKRSYGLKEVAAAPIVAPVRSHLNLSRHLTLYSPTAATRKERGQRRGLWNDERARYDPALDGPVALVEARLVRLSPGPFDSREDVVAYVADRRAQQDERRAQQVERERRERARITALAESYGCSGSVTDSFGGVRLSGVSPVALSRLAGDLAASRESGKVEVRLSGAQVEALTADEEGQR